LRLSTKIVPGARGGGRGGKEESTLNDDQREKGSIRNPKGKKSTEARGRGRKKEGRERFSKRVIKHQKEGKKNKGAGGRPHLWVGLIIGRGWCWGLEEAHSKGRAGSF